MKTTTRDSHIAHLIGVESKSAFIALAFIGSIFLFGASAAFAQVYGVRRTTVVHGPNTTVVATRTTVVAGGGALPHGYIAVLPHGYRAVVVSGARYYTVGGVYYRPQMYGGRTVYVRVHI